MTEPGTRRLPKRACLAAAGVSILVAGWWPLVIALRHRPRTLDPGHKGHISALALSPDGKLVASADESGVVRLYPADGSRPIVTLDATRLPPGDPGLDWISQLHDHHSFDGRTLQFSPDGRILVSGHGSVINVWRTADGQSMAGFREPFGREVRLRFSRDGRDLFALWDHKLSPPPGRSGQPPALKLIRWDATNWRERSATWLPLQSKGDQAVDLSPEGKVLVGMWQDEPARFYALPLDKNDHFSIDLGDCDRTFIHFAVSPDWKDFAVPNGSFSTTEIWRRSSGERRAITSTSRKMGFGVFGRLSFSPHGRDLVLMDERFEEDRLGRLPASWTTWLNRCFGMKTGWSWVWEIARHDVASGRLKSRWRWTPDRNTSVSQWTFSGNGEVLAAGTTDGKVLLWTIPRDR